MKRGLQKLIGLALVVFLFWPDTSHYFAQGFITNAPWTGTWSSAPAVTSDPGFNNQTIRQIVHTSIGGTAARLTLSNLFGEKPVTIGDVRIARRQHGARTIAGTDRQVTFNGQSYVTIPAGGSVQSDAVAFQVPTLGDIAVSMHIPSQTPPNSTGHIDAMQDVYIAPGDVSADSNFAGGVVNAAGGQSNYFLTNVDVMNAAATGAVVAFGASITEGTASTPNTNRRWPNRLAERLNRAGMTVGVLNQGISGNDFFTDASGQAGLTRFARDVLGQANVKWVIISDDAVNNLISGNPPSAQQLMTAYQRLARQAGDAKVGVICSTLTPFEGMAEWTPAIEDTRQTVNAFLRGRSSGCDAVLDQAQVLGDPASTAADAAYARSYNSGDDLHPNDAGMQAIANAVDLTWFAALPPINAPSACGRLTTGEGIAMGQSLAACSGSVELTLQDDGYLVAVLNGETIWSSHVSGTPGVEIRMQEDGNLAMYDSNGAMVWQTRTSVPGAYATIQKDGHLVIYSPHGTALWSSAG
ncbi:G-D-S-L family lipolytic protein [Caballeronia sp. NK8]|uniref:GDSL-type esterase/lipase family protein n=1 Tax=Caballeronia sp. NK8 TaxID=140098 RepID=UPI001BB6DFF7|nr:GDSL-type esterase/lipase family protein [Caballeronia sp. NK8]BCQ22590.1 G-D-S-L family lipolytic protein [Caballeronia sp. NK8]